MVAIPDIGKNPGYPGIPGDGIKDGVPDISDHGQGKGKKKCPPCPKPPKWGARIDKVPPSRPHKPCCGDHLHIYYFKYNQNPVTCRCYLQKIDYVICLE
ncbi:MAG: hypothetical protein L6416_04230 [Candidatus Omnitrophica bacterium]|nr:hypothetical protein [Candidatus Omnitrophota bacterium]